MYLIATAFAQDAAAQPNPIMNLVPIALVIIIMYIFVFLPQKKRNQEVQSFLKSLEKGHEVYTNSGILGKVTGLTDKVVTLEIEGGNKIKVIRTSIAGSSKALFEPATK